MQLRHSVFIGVAVLVFTGASCARRASVAPQTPSRMPTDIKSPHVILKTSLGPIEVELFANDSPKTVENFLTLVRKGFYDGTKFHRVIKDFMIQGGDPNSRSADWSTHGTGGPGYTFADEFNARPLVRGSLAMANAGPDTNGSQFFIVTAPATPWLDGHHTNFGRVTAGMDVVDRIEGVEVNADKHPLTDVVVERVEVRN